MGIMPTYSTQDLQALAAFVPTFEQAGFEFMRQVEGSAPTSEGLRFATFTYHREVYRLLEVLNRRGWVYGDEDFRWTEWIRTEEARLLRDEPGVLERATPLQLARLLTIFARQERFCDGAMLDFYESGLLLSILRRAAALAEAAS